MTDYTLPANKIALVTSNLPKKNFLFIFPFTRDNNRAFLFAIREYNDNINFH